MTADSDEASLGAPPPILELNHIFDALAHPRRRYLLYTLLEANEWTLRELSEKVTAWENDVPESTLYDDEVERTYVSLYHNHVPKLVEDEIIVFEEPTGTIRPGPHAEQVLAVLENAGGSHDSEQEAHARSDSDERSA